MVGTPGLVLLIAAGGGVLALWLDVRFPTLAPRAARRTFVHLIVSLAIVQFAAPWAMELVLKASDTLVLEVATLFLLFLPSQIYAFICAIWMLRILRGALLTR